MTMTVPADYIGEEKLGYSLLAIPSENTKRLIEKLLNELTVELPGTLWSMPPEQLHITLCEIIQPKDYAQDKEDLFRLHQQQYENIPGEILSQFPEFAITFDVLEASPQAIIIRASDSSAFNSIREKLITNIQLPDETRTPPDITHSSIARYIKTVELESVQDIVTRHRVNITEEIVDFKLVRNEIPPLQKYKILKTFSLASG